MQCLIFIVSEFLVVSSIKCERMMVIGKMVREREREMLSESLREESREREREEEGD